MDKGTTTSLQYSEEGQCPSCCEDLYRKASRKVQGELALRTALSHTPQATWASCSLKCLALGAAA